MQPNNKRPNKTISVYNTSNISNYEKLEIIGKGTYGTVFKAKELKSNKIVALKQLYMNTLKNGFPLTSIREINILKSMRNHPNIIKLIDVCVGNDIDLVCLVFEYCEYDMASIIDSNIITFTQAEIKNMMLQILSAISHIHDNFIMHRDLKLSNLLMNSMGQIKVADFGLARKFHIPLKKYTPKVATLWYRSPELILGSREYHTTSDIWAIGCIFAEFLTGKPLFPGNTDLEQIKLIFDLLGTPNEQIWPGFKSLPNVTLIDNIKNIKKNSLQEKFPSLSIAGIDLISKLLNYDPSKRITARNALNHEYFRENPIAVSEIILPYFEDEEELDEDIFLEQEEELDEDEFLEQEEEEEEEEQEEINYHKKTNDDDDDEYTIEDAENDALYDDDSLSN